MGCRAWPVATAARLAAANDLHDTGHILLVHKLVAADPAAWTMDVPAVLEALQRPELAAIYLAAAAQWPDAFPHGTAHAATAALDVHRALPGPLAGTDFAPGAPAAGSVLPVPRGTADGLPVPPDRGGRSSAP
ncbi:hypothetical protein CGZ69_35640 [Streptomyces peucetius subsp. caesius ATCC 27952]|nr:hypothetical protein CGZ69_35640 [Streptomyces peucetius subsp. caesius ATCC 27952]